MLYNPEKKRRSSIIQEHLTEIYLQVVFTLPVNTVIYGEIVGLEGGEETEITKLRNVTSTNG
jgi:hypothetical protein